jgi:hypothetical protein
VHWDSIGCRRADRLAQDAAANRSQSCQRTGVGINLGHQTVWEILTGFGVGEPLATNCRRAATTVPLLVRVWPLEVTWAVTSASMEIPWFA